MPERFCQDNFISIWDAFDFTCDVEFDKVVSVLHIRVKMISFHYYLVDLSQRVLYRHSSLAQGSTDRPGSCRSNQAGLA